MRAMVTGLLMLALGGEAIAQPAPEASAYAKENINSIAVAKGCTGAAEGDDTYPFSVSRIERALKIEPRQIKSVQVAVIDDGFLGFQPNADNQNGSDYIATPNFPEIFFQPDSAYEPWGNPGEDRSLPPPPRLASLRSLSTPDLRPGEHGTHVTGIVLGGMYNEASASPGVAADGAVDPQVRRVLLQNPDATGSQPKAWLSVKTLRVDYGAGGEITDPLAKLERRIQETDAKIVNMSLSKQVSPVDMRDELPPQSQGLLIVAAAGNSKTELEGRLQAVPATIPDTKSSMLVVASHDANGRFSSFSDYGRPVSIAAPGCLIRSWVDGTGQDLPLSGTSMATAVVSFAAALVSSRTGGSATAIRNRLIVSAQFDRGLVNCERRDIEYQQNPDAALPACVAYGSKLDIPVALLIRKDFIEYRDCPDQDGKKRCVKTAVGNLVAIPPTLAACVTISPAVAHGNTGMSLNSAIKIAERKMKPDERKADNDSDILLMFEGGTQVGKRGLTVQRQCGMPPPDGLFRFEKIGLQLDEPGAATPTTFDVAAEDLIRVVTRMKPN